MSIAEGDAAERIEKQYVHKHKEHNVFITPVRRELPGRIAAGAIAVGPPHQHDAAMALVERHYRRVGAERVLLEVPGVLAGRDVAAALEVLPEAGKALFRRCYVHDAARDEHRLRPEIGEAEALGLRAAFRGLPFEPREALDERAKRRVSAALEMLPGVPKVDVFWAGLVCDTTHEFFFEHPQEHVPGMLLVEACRQMVEAVWHRFGGAPFGDVFVIDHMHMSYQAYVELHEPTLLRLAPRGRANREGIWAAVEPELMVFQRGVAVASFGGKGRLIPSACFELLRTTMSAATALSAA